jgi:DNA invertase Pin-like site-specific DNA recombinase
MEEPARRIGYARVSTADQHVALHLEALEQRGCTKVLQDVASGAHGERQALTAAVE